ncbi:6-pyruvoyl trahydropterin synthase family protein [Aurantibacillus circumpalustris]|uniref:6-pyruvoyl trahydropterin synthase family protein n=1 Tax=Aurantibacillus circumpalustris TaxID=3036359 RepID=UPI00295B183A|nr:6-carboxytetrahydropterin synthase [Aurantibacillus circumpalustris]
MRDQRIRVTKSFTFDMAHALYGYDGLCKNIHGHTYKLHITLLGKVLNDYENPKDGMVMDFSDLKKLVQQQILSIYDHALVLNGDSPHAELKDLKENFEKIVFLENQPTCENLVLDIVYKLKKKLPENVILHAIKLKETPTSFAEWYTEDNL